MRTNAYGERTHPHADSALITSYRRVVGVNPYEMPGQPKPTPASAKKPETAGQALGKIGIVLAAITLPIVGLIVVMYFGHCYSNPNTSVARCDSSHDDERYAWLTKPADGEPSPHDQGLRIGDSCARVLQQRMPQCDRDYLRKVNNDAPILRAAVRVGFTHFECEGPSGKARFPLGEFVH